MSIRYERSPIVDEAALNGLFAKAWPNHAPRAFAGVLGQSLAYVCAFDSDDELVGFVNLAWDGGKHAFVLDTTVHPDVRRRGVGTALVNEAAEIARGRGIRWLHVDFESHLRDFYIGACGFRPTDAGLIDLQP